MIETTVKIDAVIKALGTMVMIPQYDTDPNVIGLKTFAGNIQTPIMEGEDRKQAEAKLLELIKSL